MVNFLNQPDSISGVIGAHILIGFELDDMTQVNTITWYSNTVNSTEGATTIPGVNSKQTDLEIIIQENMPKYYFIVVNDNLYSNIISANITSSTKRIKIVYNDDENYYAKLTITFPTANNNNDNDNNNNYFWMYDKFGPQFPGASSGPLPTWASNLEIKFGDTTVLSDDITFLRLIVIDWYSHELSDTNFDLTRVISTFFFASPENNIRGSESGNENSQLFNGIKYLITDIYFCDDNFELSQPLVDIEKTIGTSVTFNTSVSTSLNSSVTYRWYSNIKRTTQNGKFIITGNNLTVSNISESTDRYYYYIASITVDNFNYKLKSNVVKLTVKNTNGTIIQIPTKKKYIGVLTNNAKMSFTLDTRFDLLPPYLSLDDFELDIGGVKYYEKDVGLEIEKLNFQNPINYSNGDLKSQLYNFNFTRSNFFPYLSSMFNTSKFTIYDYSNLTVHKIVSIDLDYESFKITTQPTNMESTIGGAASSTVLIQGASLGTIEYKWYSNGLKSTKDATLITSANSSTLNISNIQNSTHQYYFVVIKLIENGITHVRTSDIAYLEITGFTNPNHKKYIMYYKNGYSLDFTIDITSSFQNVTDQTNMTLPNWLIDANGYFDTKKYTRDDFTIANFHLFPNNSLNINEIKQSFYNIFIGNNFIQDNSNYFVNFTYFNNQNGVDLMYIYLQEPTFYITTQPSNIEAYLGDNASLTVNTSLSEVSYFWIGSSSNNFQSQRSQEFSTTNTYEIKNITSNTPRYYYVKISKTINNITYTLISNFVKLKIIRVVLPSYKVLKVIYDSVQTNYCLLTIDPALYSFSSGSDFSGKMPEFIKDIYLTFGGKEFFYDDIMGLNFNTKQALVFDQSISLSQFNGLTFFGKNSGIMGLFSNPLGFVYENRLYTITSIGLFNASQGNSLAITSHPANVSGNLGSSVTFTVEISPVSANVEYRWYSNTSNSRAGSTIINFANTKTLTVNVIDEEIPLYYYVIITDSNNSELQSNIAKLTIPGALTLERTFEIIYDNNSDYRILLTIDISKASSVMEYNSLPAWINNISAVFGNTVLSKNNIQFFVYNFTNPVNYNLKDLKSQLTDFGISGWKDGVGISYNGNFTAWDFTSSKLRTITSINQLLPGFEITTQPANIEKGLGTTATFSVVVTNTGSIEYQWYSNTEKSTNNGQLLVGKTTSTFTTDPITRNTPLFYYVKIINSNGTFSNTTYSLVAKLKITGVLSSNEKKYEIIYNNNPAYKIVFVIDTTQQTNVFGFQSLPDWLLSIDFDFNGVRYSRSDFTGFVFQAPNTIDFNNKNLRAQVFDINFFSGVALNGFGPNMGSYQNNTYTISSVLQLFDGFSIITQPSNVSTTENSNATFTVTAETSSGTLSYKWFTNSEKSIIGSTEVINQTNPTMTINNVSLSTNKYYYVVVYCSVNDNVYELRSDFVELNISFSQNNLYIKSINSEIFCSTNNSTWNTINNKMPFILAKSSPSSTNKLNVIFTTDITITNSSQYFIIGSDYIEIDGNNKKIILSNVNNYEGLINNGSVSTNGYSNIIVKNINVPAGSSLLKTNGGWICQKYWSKNSSGCEVFNCFSLGTISSNSGGISGSNSSGSFTKCYSTGIIGLYGGGICGKESSATVTNCYSFGTIKSNSGGIFGNSSSGTAINCYSLGNYSLSSNAGGIFSSTTTGTTTNCYSANGTWSDTNANSSLVLSDLNNTYWYDISTLTTIPYVINSFSFDLYSTLTLSKSYGNTVSSSAAILSGGNYRLINQITDLTIDAATGIIYSGQKTPGGIHEIKVLFYNGTINLPYNYYIGTVTLTVDKINLDVVATSKSILNNESIPALTYTATGFVNGESKSDLGGNLTTNATVGTAGNYDIEQGTLNSTNYTINFTKGTLSITQVQNTLVIIPKETKITYGDTIPTIEFSVSGLEAGDTAGTVLTGSISVEQATKYIVGNYNFIIGTLASTKYTLSINTQNKLIVEPKPLTITANNITKEYDAQVKSFTGNEFSCTGLVNQDLVSNATIACSGINAGTHTITISTALPNSVLSNYTVEYVTGTLTISKKTVNIVADNKSKRFNSQNPSLTFTSTGLIAGQSNSVFRGSLLTDVTTDTNVGTYDINVGTLDADNYQINFTKGTLTVQKAQSEISDFPNIPNRVFRNFPFTPLLPSKVNYNSNIHYTISDSTIATIDELTGMITMLKAGNVKITATAPANEQYDSSIKESNNFDIQKSQSQLEDFVINNQVLDVANKTFTPVLPKIIVGSGPIVYSSSNTSVATVDSGNGLITLKTAGSVTISATIQTNDQYFGTSKEATFGIITIPAPPNYASAQDVSVARHDYLSGIFNDSNNSSISSFNLDKSKLGITDGPANVLVAKPGGVINVSSTVTDDQSAYINLNNPNEQVTLKIGTKTLVIKKTNDDKYQINNGITLYSKDETVRRYNMLIRFGGTGVVSSPTEISSDGGNVYLTQSSTTSFISYSLDNTNWTPLNENWPVNIINTSTNSSVLTLNILSDILINDTTTGEPENAYLIIKSNNITINGNNHKITIDGVIKNQTDALGYKGFVQNGTGTNNTANSDQKSNIKIKNLGIIATNNSVLFDGTQQGGGWIAQSYWGTANCEISNCYSTGPVAENSGGIVGYMGSGVVTDCYSTGSIGVGAGGIFGANSVLNASANNCYSLGSIGNEAGGIFGKSSLGSANNCYSIGTIGTDGGGIRGNLSSVTITNCYFASGTWSDSNATSATGTNKLDTSTAPTYSNGSLDNSIGSKWIDMSSSNTVPYILKSFATDTIYTSGSNSTSKEYGSASQTTSSGNLSGGTYTLLNVLTGVTVNQSTGAITFGSNVPAGTHEIKVLYWDNNLTPLYGYLIGTWNLTISKASITLVVPNITIKYGQTPVLTFTENGLKNGETTGTQGSLTTTATSSSIPAEYSISISSITSNNYNFSLDSSTLNPKVIVQPADLTIIPNEFVLTYGDPIPNLTYTTTGLVNGNTQSIITGNLETLASSTSNVNQYLITQSSSNPFSAPNYNIIFTSGKKITINQKPIAITPMDQTKTYTGTAYSVSAQNTDTNTMFTVSGLLSGQSIASLTFSSDSANKNASATPYILTSSNAVAGSSTLISNYNIRYNTAQLTIQKAPLVLTIQDQTKTYGDSATNLTFTATGFVNSESYDKISGNLSSTGFNATQLGNFPITYNNLTSTNYSFSLHPSYTDPTLTIIKATLTISPTNINIEYGQNIPQLLYAATGFVNGDTSTSGVISGSLTTNATNSSNIGEYTFSTSNLTATNYNFSLDTTKKLTISKKPITIAASSQIKTYTGQVHNLNSTDPSIKFFTVSPNMVLGQSISDVTLASTGTNSSNTPYTISITDAVAGSNTDLNNYNITYQPGQLTINKATITITPTSNQSIIYGESIPASLTYTSSGFVNGETNAVISGTLSTDATDTSNAGTYNYLTSGFSANNYSFEIAYGNSFIINPKPITITATNQTKPYIGTTQNLGTSSFTVTGLKSGQSLSSVSLSSTGINVLPDGQTYLIIPSDPVAGSYTNISNYTISYANGELTITKVPVTIYPQNKTISLGSQIPALTFTASGLLNGQSTSVISGSLATTATNTSPVGNYPISIGTLSSNNYTLTLGAGTYNVTVVETTQLTPTTSWNKIIKIFNSDEYSFIIPKPISNSSGTIEYTSSNPAIASIDGNTITIHNIGTVMITAKQSSTEEFFEHTISTPLTITSTNKILINGKSVQVDSTPIDTTEPISNAKSISTKVVSEKFFTTLTSLVEYCDVIISPNITPDTKNSILNSPSIQIGVDIIKSYITNYSDKDAIIDKINQFIKNKSKEKSITVLVLNEEISGLTNSTPVSSDVYSNTGTDSVFVSTSFGSFNMEPGTTTVVSEINKSLINSSKIDGISLSDLSVMLNFEVSKEDLENTSLTLRIPISSIPNFNPKKPPVIIYFSYNSEFGKLFPYEVVPGTYILGDDFVEFDLPHTSTIGIYTGSGINFISTGGDPMINPMFGPKYSLAPHVKFVNLLSDFSNKIFINAHVDLLNKNDFPKEIYWDNSFSKIENAEHVYTNTYYRRFFIYYAGEAIEIEADTLAVNKLSEINKIKILNYKPKTGIKSISFNKTYPLLNTTKSVKIGFNNFILTITSDISTDDRHYVELLNVKPYGRLRLSGALVSKNQIIKITNLVGPELFNYDTNPFLQLE